MPFGTRVNRGIAVIAAAAALVSYAEHTSGGARNALGHVKSLGVEKASDLLDLPPATLRNLELTQTLRGDDLFAATKFPQAHFSATRFNKTASGFEAIGKLTLRGVTHDMTVPFTFRTTTENGAAVGYMDGKTSLKRLDYGVGQGDWKATDQLANDVGVSFALRLLAH